MKIISFFFSLLIAGNINAQDVFRAVPVSQAIHATPTSENMQINAIPEFSMGIGYCDDYPEKYSAIGIGRKATLSGAIYLPARKFENRGNQIVAFRFLNRSSDAKNYEMFIYKSLDEEPIYTQSFDSQGTGWNYIYLDTPYELKNEDLYIGYSTLTSESPFGYIEPMRNNDADYVRIATGVWSHLSANGLPGTHCMQAIVTGGNYSDRNQQDVALDLLNSNEYVQADIPFSPEIAISNRGVKAIHNLDIDYSINGETGSIKIEELAIPFGMNYVITLPEMKLPLGDYTLEVKAIKVNGETDDDESNNLLSVHIASITKYFKRNLLLEQFTGTGCSYCPEGAAALKAAIKGQEDKIVWVAHHSGFSKDMLTIDESSEYTWFYNDVSTYAPACMLDRTRLKTLLVSPGPGPIFDSRKTTKSMIEALLAIPAYAQLNAQSTFDATTRKLTVTIDGESTQELPYAKLNVFLTQDGIVFRQEGEGGGNNYQHDHTIRDVLSDVWGDNVEFVDNKFTKTYTYTLPEEVGIFECIPEKMHIIAFLADYRENRPNECQVHNSVIIPLGGSTVGIERQETESLNIYSIGNNLYIDGDYEIARIYSAQGILMKSLSGAINTCDLANGIYIVKVISGNKIQTKKVILK